MINLDSRVVLVTGGGSGIGKAIAHGMAANGARVAVVDIDFDSAKRVAAELNATGREALALAGDVGEEASIDDMAVKARERFGRVDVLVNNAGITKRAYIMDLTADDWDRMHRVNARGVFLCLQRIGRDMIANGGGRIINIASVAGRGFKDTSNAAYAASKGAVIALTRIAAHQLARHDITVNAVCPGVTRTSILDDLISRRAALEDLSLEQAEQAFASHIPLGRVNEAEDIANMCVFLASDAARNITGQSMNVDGGIMMT